MQPIFSRKTIINPRIILQMSRFTTHVFWAVQKTRSMCFTGFKTLGYASFLNPIKHCCLFFKQMYKVILGSLLFPTYSVITVSGSGNGHSVLEQILVWRYMSTARMNIGHQTLSNQILCMFGQFHIRIHTERSLLLTHSE